MVYTEIINATTELALLISLLRTVEGHFIVIFKASGELFCSSQWLGMPVKMNGKSYSSFELLPCFATKALH